MAEKEYFRRSGKPWAILLLMLSMLLLTLSSCSPKLVFGEVLICSDVDINTFEPIGIGNEYSINSPQINAAIRISGVRGEDRWRFTWRNADTEEIIADFTNTYSKNNSGFMEGYLSTRLLPSSDSGIIAEPGKYIVSYYHNSELVDAADFIIQQPGSKILGVDFFKSIGEDGEPRQKTNEFYQKDEIYAVIKTDYMIVGDILSLKNA